MDSGGSPTALARRAGRVPGLALVVLVLAASACGSGGSAAPADTAAGPGASDAVVAGPSASAGGTDGTGTGPVTSTGSPQPTLVAGPADPPPSAPRSTLDPAVAKLTGPALERYLADRFRAYWDAFDAARAKPTTRPATDFPKLAQLAAGDQLATSYTSITQLAKAGQALREPETPAVPGTPSGQAQRVRIDSVDGAVAQLTSCTVNDDQVVTAATGAVVRGGVASVRATATLAVTNGQWKLIRSQAVQIDPGVAGCWLEAGTYPY